MMLAPEIMNKVFDIIESPYPLRNELRFKSRNIRTVRYGIETAALVGSRIWSYMSSELNDSTSLNKFRSKIKTWKPENCPCKKLQKTARLLTRLSYQLVFAHRYCYICFFICFYAYLFCCSFCFSFWLVLFCLLLSSPNNIFPKLLINSEKLKKWNIIYYVKFKMLPASFYVYSLCFPNSFID